jgi:hypothetical protein
MNVIPVATLLGSLALLAAVFLILKGRAVAREVFSPVNEFLDDGAEIPACPPEFVSKVFSPCDAKFVSGTRSNQLIKLFRSERKMVALVWVRQVSAAIQRTIRDHTRMARASEGLELVTEVKLFLTYAELMLFCGVLFVAIQSAGPAWLGRMAVYVDAHSQRLAEAQQSFRAATTPREFPRVGAA